MISQKHLNNIKNSLRTKTNMSDEEIDWWCKTRLKHKSFDERFNSFINRELNPKSKKRENLLINAKQPTEEQLRSYFEKKDVVVLCNKDKKLNLKCEEDELRGY